MCHPVDTHSVCWGIGATPPSCCSSTNLIVTVPFIPPIGHGALWQSHVFAHWERQFLANINRTVAHKKGRATCTAAGANPTHLFAHLLTCLVCRCVPLDWSMLYLVVVESCWMLNVSDLPLVVGVWGFLVQYQRYHSLATFQCAFSFQSSTRKLAPELCLCLNFPQYILWRERWFCQ